MVSLFDRIKSAQASVDSNYLRPGRYLVRIDRVIEKEGRKGAQFICEATVAHVYKDKNEVSVPPSEGETDQGPNKPGEQFGYVVAFYGNGADSAPGNVKRFILNLLDMDESEADQSNPAKMKEFEEGYQKIVGSRAISPYLKLDGSNP